MHAYAAQPLLPPLRPHPLLTKYREQIMMVHNVKQGLCMLCFGRDERQKKITLRYATMSSPRRTS
jgi:hypothetical protein